MRNKKIIDGAKAIAADLNSAAGRIKFARVVKVHLDWFMQVQECGLTWQQISEVLTRAGARREDGTPFSIGMISSTVWRATQLPAQQRAELTEIRHRFPSARSLNVGSHSGNAKSSTTNTTANGYADKDVRKIKASSKAEDSSHAKMTPSIIASNTKNSEMLNRGEIRRRMAKASRARRT
jgi:hypothetical protein